MSMSEASEWFCECGWWAILIGDFGTVRECPKCGVVITMEPKACLVIEEEQDDEVQ